MSRILSVPLAILRRGTRAVTAARTAAAATAAATLLLISRTARAAADLSGASGGDPISILSTYGPSIGGMYLAYLVARGLITRASDRSGDPGRLSQLIAWLRVGKRLAYATSILGVAGAALQALLTGAPWTVVLGAAAAAAFKLITPSVELEPAPPPGPPTSTS
jgi:hypothetical protein